MRAPAPAPLPARSTAGGSVGGGHAPAGLLLIDADDAIAEIDERRDEAGVTVAGASITCAPAGAASARARRRDAARPSPRTHHRTALDRLGAVAKDQLRVVHGHGLAAPRRRPAMRGQRSGGRRRSRSAFHISLAGLAQLEVGHRAPLGSRRVVEQRAVDPDLFRPGVDAEAELPFHSTTSAILPGLRLPVTGRRCRAPVAGVIAAPGPRRLLGVDVDARAPGGGGALATSWLRRWMPLASSEWIIAQAPCLLERRRDSRGSRHRLSILKPYQSAQTAAQVPLALSRSAIL